MLIELMDLSQASAYLKQGKYKAAEQLYKEVFFLFHVFIDFDAKSKSFLVFSVVLPLPRIHVRNLQKCF